MGHTCQHGSRHLWARPGTSRGAVAQGGAGCFPVTREKPRGAGVGADPLLRGEGSRGKGNRLRSGLEVALPHTHVPEGPGATSGL